MVKLRKSQLSRTISVLSLISTLKTWTEMVLETLAFSSLNHLTRLAAQEYVFIQCRRES
jgi:hypothetical protein